MAAHENEVYCKSELLIYSVSEVTRGQDVRLLGHRIQGNLSVGHEITSEGCKEVLESPHPQTSEYNIHDAMPRFYVSVFEAYLFENKPEDKEEKICEIFNKKILKEKFKVLEQEESPQSDNCKDSHGSSLGNHHYC